MGGDILIFGHQPGAALKGQGVNRHIGGPKGQHPFQASLKALQTVSGQAHNQVRVNVPEAHLTGQGKGRLHTGGAVGPANGLQHLVRQALGVDADAPHTGSL